MIPLTMIPVRSRRDVRSWSNWPLNTLPSGNLTVCYWKLPFSSLIYPLNMVIFQFVMLVYQRVQRRIKSVRSSYNVASSRCASSRDCLSRQLNMNVIMFHSTHTPLPCSTTCATRHQLRMKITNENWQKRGIVIVSRNSEKNNSALPHRHNP